MSVEHRLHHAARELRELPIETPPLAAIQRHRRPARVLQVLAAPLLLVASMVFAYGVLQSGPSSGVDTDRPVVSAPTAPSAVDEHEVIAVLLERSDAAAGTGTGTDDGGTEVPQPAVFGSVRPV